MKNIIRHLKTVDMFSFLIGVAVSLALLFLLSLGTMGKSSTIEDTTNVEKHEVTKEGSTQMGTNPYMMGKITSERQFLQQMKIHHEAAVTMAQQVLLIRTIRPEIKKLANDIISAQTTEIRMMKDWLAAWK